MKLLSHCILTVFLILLMIERGAAYAQLPTVSVDPAFLAAPPSLIRVLNPTANSEEIASNFEFVLYDVTAGKDFPVIYGVPEVRLMKQVAKQDGRSELMEVRDEYGKPMFERDEISKGHYRLFMEIARIPRPLAAGYKIAISFANPPKNGGYSFANPALVSVAFEERGQPHASASPPAVETFALPGRVETDLPPRGKTVQLHCARQSKYSYRCYVPLSFDSRKRGVRVLLHSSPGGNAKPLATDFAERTGWITVGLTESRNGDWQLIERCRNAIIADLRERLNPPFGSKWLVFAGFSGGARASAYAGYQHSQETAGILCMNAGIQASPSEPKIWNFPVAFIEGTEDMNAAEVLGDCDRLKNAGKSYLLLRYTGGHVMPPQAKITEALDWLVKQTPLLPAIPRTLAKDPIQFQEEARFPLSPGNSIRLEASDDRGNVLAWVESKNKQERAVINGKPTDWYDEVSGCRFSKNGLHYSYNARIGKRVKLFVDGKEVAMTRNSGGTVFSADGAHLAYAEENFVKAGTQVTDHFDTGYFDQEDIWVDGRQVMLPISGTTSCRGMSMSEDGKHIAFKIHQGKPEIADKPELPEREYLWLDGQIKGPYDRIESSLSFGHTADCTFFTDEKGDISRTMYTVIENGQRVWIVNGQQRRFPLDVSVSHPYVTREGLFQFYSINEKTDGRTHQRIYFAGRRLNIPGGFLINYDLSDNGDLSLMQEDSASSDLLEIYRGTTQVGCVNLLGYVPYRLRTVISPVGDRIAFTAPLPVPDGEDASEYLYPVVVVCGDYASPVLDDITTMRFTDDGHLLVVGQKKGKWYLFLDGYASQGYDEILDTYAYAYDGETEDAKHSYKGISSRHTLNDIFAFGVRQGKIYRIKVKRP